MPRASFRRPSKTTPKPPDIQVRPGNESQGACGAAKTDSAVRMVVWASRNQLSKNKTYLGAYKLASPRFSVASIYTSSCATGASLHLMAIEGWRRTRRKRVPHVASCDCRCCPRRLSCRPNLFAGPPAYDDTQNAPNGACAYRAAGKSTNTQPPHLRRHPTPPVVAARYE